VNFSEAWEVNASRVLRRVGVPKTLVRLEIAIAVRTRADFILMWFGGQMGGFFRQIFTFSYRLMEFKL
jgi:hypothetical protein